MARHLTAKELFAHGFSKGERIEEPAQCCVDTWQGLDLWDDEFLPDEFECPKCGTIGVIVPFVHQLSLPEGVPQGAIKADGFLVEYYRPLEEVPS